MSVLPSTTDIVRRPRFVRFVPTGDPCSAPKNVVIRRPRGDDEQVRRNGEAERLRSLRLITNSNFVGRTTGRSAGLAPLRIWST
jgi:hypothetical protein